MLRKPLTVPALHPSVVSEHDGLDSLADVWPRVWGRTDPRPPMLEFAWVREWWRCHGGEGNLLLVLVNDQAGSPVGLAPLYVRHLRFDRAGFLRTVHFLGTGERADDEIHGECNGWLGPPEIAAAVSAEVARILLARRGSWDRIVLENLWPDRGIARDLPLLLRPILAESRTSRTPTFRSPASSLEEYIERIPSRKMRSNCRRALKAGAAKGVQFVRCRSTAEALEMFDALAALHQRHWRKRGRRGAFASALFREFHRTMLAHYGTAELPWLVGLKQSDRWIALGHHLSAGDRLYAYVLGMETATTPALSPGLLLYLHSIDAAASSGIAVYDFLGGDAVYKRRLALEEDEMLTLDCLQSNLRGRLWGRARKLRARVRDAVKSTNDSL